MKKMLTGNSAAAWGARASDVDYICAYPITPQSEIVETLSAWVSKGALRAKFVNFESEHSMLAAAGAASLAGARVFTCTASQGLVYGLEMLYSIAGWRAPLVLVNVSRGVGMPMILQVEHGDVLATRDTGFIQLHAETCQEVLDFVLLGYRIAEDQRILLPVIVNMDGFVLSFAREGVSVPGPDTVGSFLKGYSRPHPLLGLEGDPVVYAPTTTDGEVYTYYKSQLHEGLAKSREIFLEASRDFDTKFGRKYGTVERFMIDDAETVVVTTNSYSSNIRAAVRQLRASGEKVGMLKLTMVRPFPREEVAAALRTSAKVAVFEQNFAPGRGGILYPEVVEALYHSDERPRVVASFIGGIGGIAVGLGEVKLMVRKCDDLLSSGADPGKPTLIYTSANWAKMRNYLEVAGVSHERREGGRVGVGPKH